MTENQVACEGDGLSRRRNLGRVRSRHCARPAFSVVEASVATGHRKDDLGMSLRIRITSIATGLILGAGLVTTTAPATVASAAPTTVCGGTGNLLETGLQSVSGAALIDHTPAASNGPNLILNGDFTFSADDTDMAATQARGGLVPGTTGGGTPVAIRDWTAFGGGRLTYAKWGSLVHGGEPPPAPADASMVYFGNALGATWKQDSGTAVATQDGFRNPLSFNADGAALSNITVTPRDNSPNFYGTSTTPVTLTQTVTGLTSGTRYRLQFWMTGENRTTRGYVDPGLFGLDISGYHRVWVVVPSVSGYFTIDFIAASSSTQVAFNVWGHTNPINSGPGPTELILDDVILAACDDSGGLSAPAHPVASRGQNPPWAIDDHYYTPFQTSIADGDVRRRDVIPSGAALSKLTDPANGTVTWNGDGTFVYTPDPGFTGADSFDYQVCSILCVSATQWISVGGQAPRAVDGAHLTDPDTAMTAQVADADDFPAGSTFSKVTDPAHGTVTWNPDGTYTYTPSSGFVGTDSFTYEVCPRQAVELRPVSDIGTYPDGPESGGKRTAWFSFTPTASGDLTLDTAESTYDTYLWLTDDTGGVLAEDDDSSSENWRSLLTYAVTAGQTYFAKVGGYIYNSQYDVGPTSVLGLSLSGLGLAGCSTATEAITVGGALPPPPPPASYWTLSYDGQGGMCSTPSHTVANGGVAVVGDGAATCSRPGHVFAGWRTAPEGSGLVAAGTSLTMTSHVVLYASWQSAIEWTLSYDGQGGVCSTPSQTVTDGGVAVVGDGLVTCARPGHSFAGWRTAPGGSAVVAPGTALTMTEDVQLYASWVPVGPPPPVSSPMTPPFVRDFGVTSEPTRHVFQPLKRFKPSKGATVVASSLQLRPKAGAGWDRSVTVPGKGTFTAVRGRVVFVGVPGWSGTVVIRYRAQDTSGQWAASTLTVRVAKVPGGVYGGR